METPDIIATQIDRINRGIAAQRTRLERFSPDAIVVLVSDTHRMFTGVQTPQFCTYLGNEIWGSARLAELSEPAEDDVIRLKCAPDFAANVHGELVHHGFDMSYSKGFKPLRQPAYGVTPALVEPLRALLSGSNAPIVPIFVNTSVAPAPTGHRCRAFGRTLADILGERPERVAMIAVGGLSHNHQGPRAGWIDEPLDRWVLDNLARGKAQELASMFDLESDTLLGGSAQVRLWIVVGAALEKFGAKATVLDYFPSYTAATGIGFVAWSAESS